MARPKRNPRAPLWLRPGWGDTVPDPDTGVYSQPATSDPVEPIIPFRRFLAEFGSRDVSHGNQRLGTIRELLTPADDPDGYRRAAGLLYGLAASCALRQHEKAKLDQVSFYRKTHREIIRGARAALRLVGRMDRSGHHVHAGDHDRLVANYRALRTAALEASRPSRELLREVKGFDPAFAVRARFLLAWKDRATALLPSLKPALRLQIARVLLELVLNLPEREEGSTARQLRRLATLEGGRSKPRSREAEEHRDVLARLLERRVSPASDAWGKTYLEELDSLRRGQ